VYDCLVVGSGYGGATVAARLAPKRKVLLVERGKRWRPGEFPGGLAGIARSYMSARNPSGLWAMRLGKGTGNAFASALGGASAINYGITARPDDHVFATWPVSAVALAPYFERALAVLQPRANPIAAELGDQQFLDRIEPGRRVDLVNTIDFSECDNCGECVPGCNKGAKRSLDRTYLALAMDAGAEVKVETTVRRIEPTDAGYRVQLSSTTGAAADEWVPARQVAICAGTLGTLDLMHSLRDVFALSPQFGTRLSMNGDGLAFLYNTTHRLSSHSGAPISTCVRIPFVDPGGDTRTLMVMSGRVPKAAARFAAAALAVLADVVRDRVAPYEPDGGAGWRRLKDLSGAGPGGALSQSFMFKLDSQDSGRGVARFGRDGKVVIDWPDYAEDPINQFAAERLVQWAVRAGGTVVPNVASLPGMRSFSVHPLGGCRMGHGPDDGVVDDVGRVFRPAGGFYPGLRIIDASIVPTSVGVPPSLTVAAVAERAAEHMLAEA